MFLARSRASLLCFGPILLAWIAPAGAVGKAPARLVTAAARLDACDAAWLHETLESPDYCDFRNGKLPLDEETFDRISELALADSLTAQPAWRQIKRVWLYESSACSAGALYNALQSYCGDPSGGHALLADIAFRHRNRDIRELDAALFAHVRDKSTYYSYTESVLPFPRRARGEHNLFVACASKLSQRPAPYMALEWRRLAGFTENAAVRAVGEKHAGAAVTEEVKAFTALASSIKAMHARLGGRADPPDTLERCTPDWGKLPVKEYAVSDLNDRTRSYCQLLPILKRYCHVEAGPDRWFRSGYVRLQGTASDLRAVEKLLGAIRAGGEAIVPLSEGRAAVVLPCEGLEDGEHLREMGSVQCVSNGLGFFVPQKVMVACTTAADAKAVLQILESLDENESKETVVPFSDGTKVAVLRTPKPWVKLGGRNLLFEHLPADEDCRLVEFSGYTYFAVLKASEAGIACIRAAVGEFEE